MALENLLSQMGFENKQITDRYAEVPVHDHHVYYAYEPSAPSHGAIASSKHNYGGSHKSNASMSALTLLAFLFFLHILQQCIKDHMTEMSTSPVVVMTGGREGDDIISKSNFNKFDKAGVSQTETDKSENDRMDVDKYVKLNEKYDAKNPYFNEDSNKNQLKKLNTVHATKSDGERNKYIYKNYANRSSNYAGFVNAMDEE